MIKAVVESTREQIEVVDQYGNQLGILEIDLSDFNFLKRAETCEKNIETLMDEAKKIAADKTDGDAAVVDQITSLDEKMKKELDTMFDYGVSGVVFGNIHCMSMRNGVPFIERFLDTILPICKDVIKKESDESNKRVAKYLPQDYQRKAK